MASILKRLGPCLLNLPELGDEHPEPGGEQLGELLFFGAKALEVGWYEAILPLPIVNRT